MKNKKTPLMHKYHPGGYVGWGVAIILLIILAVLVTMYVVKEQGEFENEIASLNTTTQDVVERSKIRSISEKLGAMKDEVMTIAWNSYALNDSVVVKYPEGQHVYSQDYFEPYGREVLISKEPFSLTEGELDKDHAVIVSQRLIVDVVSEEDTAKEYIGEEMLDLNNIKEETYVSATGLVYLHISGEPKIAAELDQPSELYTLLYSDEEGQLYHLLITSIEEVSAPGITDIIDTIELASGFSQPE